MNNDTISVLYGDLVTLIGHTSSKSLKVIYCSYYAKLFLLFRDFVYLFLERGEGGREIERETSTVKNIAQLPLTRPQTRDWPSTKACALIGNQTSNFSIYQMTLNQLSYTSQGQAFFPTVQFPSHSRDSWSSHCHFMP